VVTLFTAFPPAFADLFTALLVPLVIVLVGIVFRGAAFAFRHFGTGTEAALPGMAALFSVASVITPLTMGSALGAIAGGHVTVEDGVITSGIWKPWLQPFSIVCGLIAVTICGYLAAYYMTVRTTGEMREDFRKRGLLAGFLLGALTTVALLVAYWDAEPFWDELADPTTLAVMGSAVVMGLASLVVLWRRWYALAPPAAAGTVALVIAGWGAAQYPYFILPHERISDVVAADATLAPFLITLVAGSVILVPSLALLYFVFSEKTGGSAIEGEGYEY
jgi:cytochrome d ubiquinol oxidase subunit II